MTTKWQEPRELSLRISFLGSESRLLGTVPYQGLQMKDEDKKAKQNREVMVMMEKETRDRNPIMFWSRSE